ncbi:MAG: zinc ABC transporter substrate-binding protein [Acidimicrobiales bacterium]|nr:zinc ABC transporter substrate-binding protein [Acidimicrobiales bacterium]
MATPTTSRLRTSLSAAVVTLLALTATGCGEGSDEPTARSDEPRLTVVTTVSPITSIVANVAGAEVEVIGLVPEGVNSHTFEPPPSAAATLARADVVFINGLGLEDPTEDLAHGNIDDEALIVKLGDEILPESEWIYDFSFPEDGGKPNPHLWTNPPMVRAYVEVVRDVLGELDPEHEAEYEANADRFLERVDELDRAMAEATATIEEADRTLLTYHDAYAYFADHYGWTVVGAIQPSDFGEPSARDVADLIRQIRAQDVPVVFGSEVFPSPVLEQIAAETGADYVDDLRDDDLPGGPGDDGHSWLGLMRLNYVTMVEALGGDATALGSIDVSDTTDTRATYPQ